MAFESKTNRFSVQAIFPWMPKMPLVGGDIDQKARMQVASVYCGNLIAMSLFDHAWFRLATRGRWKFPHRKVRGRL